MLYLKVKYFLVHVGAECRVLLMTFAEEIHDPLKDLVEVTWTSKYLYAAIFQEVKEPYSRE